MSPEARPPSSPENRPLAPPNRTQLERLRTVHLLTESVSRARRLEEIYEAALDGLTRALAADRASILLFDPDGVMRFKAWRGLSEAYRAAVEGHSPWSADAVDPQPIVVPDVTRDTSLQAFRPLFESEGIGALGFIPLTSRGRLLGKFMVYFAHPYALDEEEIRLAQVIAGHVAFAVDRRRDEEIIQRDLYERNRIEEAMTFLAGASVALDRSLDYDETVRSLAALAVPYLGEWALVETVASAGGPATKIGVSLPDQTEGHDTVTVPLRARGRLLGVLTLGSSEVAYGPREIAIAEDLGRRAATALDNARLYREAQESDRRKEEFLAVLAHELRNPLMPLLTCLELMRVDDAVEGDEARSARSGGVRRAIMERQVRNLKRLVDDLLDVSRVTQGKIELQRRAVPLASVVAAAVETTRPWFESHGLHLAVRVDPTVSVQADSLRLEQALANLLSNAAKYTPRGGHVEVSGTRDGDSIVLQVKDDGAGIAADMLPRVFDLFVQGGRSAGGLGVGLTLARTLVELHGGTVSAASAGPGTGSEFTIRVPMGSADEPEGAVDSVLDPGTGVRPLRVLVVDDNVDAASVLAEALRLRGHDVAVAHDGHSAIAEAAGRAPDLVLLDLGLPDLDGYDVARRLREEPSLRTTRIVAISGYGPEQYPEHDKERFGGSGLDEHLVKPIDLAQLDRILGAAAAGSVPTAGRGVTEPAA